MKLILKCRKILATIKMAADNTWTKQRTITASAVWLELDKMNVFSQIYILEIFERNFTVTATVQFTNVKKRETITTKTECISTFTIMQNVIPCEDDFCFLCIISMVHDNIYTILWMKYVA